MEYIHFEKQEGSLCAQHCLNSLLQGPYFNAVDLAQLAYELDEAERCKMAEGDINSEEYAKFMNVICRALSVWNLTAISYSNPEVENARHNPAGEKAFICNLQQHWFTIRKLGLQWFNLNSVSSGPELVSETYLSLFLRQLQNDGYSIFIVRGEFPESESDQMLTLLPVDPTEVKSTSTRGKNKTVAKTREPPVGESKTVNVDEVRRKRQQFYATKFNNSDETTSTTNNMASSSNADETEDEMLQRALELSLINK